MSNKKEKPLAQIGDMTGLAEGSRLAKERLVKAIVARVNGCRHDVIQTMNGKSYCAQCGVQI